MPAPLRVLHVTPYFEDAWAYGGIPRVVSRLARGTARRGHRVCVLTTDAMAPGEPLLPPEEHPIGTPWTVDPATDPDGLELTVHPNAVPGFAHRYQFFTPRGLATQVRKMAPELDIAHLHAIHNLPTARAARKLRAAAVPYLLHPNGTAPLVEGRRLAKWLFDRLFARGLLAGAAGVLAVSAAEERQLLELGICSSRIHRLPNPIDVDELEPPPEPGELQRLWPGGGRTVLYLGQVTPRKGVDTLIDALPLLPNDVRLAVLGADRGLVGSLLRRAKQAGIDHRVAFLGPVNGPARYSALAEAEVVAYPSRDEVFGLSALEALLVGTPVVVGDDSGCGELIAELGGGLTVPPGRPTELASALTRVFDDPGTFRRDAAAAGARIRRELDTTTVCELLEGIYREILQEESR